MHAAPFLSIFVAVWTLASADVKQPAGPPPEGDRPEAILRQAFADHQAGEFSKAIEGYRRVLEAGFRHPDLLTNLGAACAAAGDNRAAIGYYQEALQLDPRHTGARLNLGLAYYKAAQAVPAIEQFSEVLRLEPGHSQAAFLLADSYFRLGQYPKVIEVLNPFREKAETDQGFAYLLGTSLIRTGRVPDGQHYVDLILRHGDSAPAHLLMATAYRTGGEVEKAIQEIRKALALDPTLPGAYALLGKLLMAVDGVDQLDRNPQLLGEIHLGSGGDDAAEAFHRELQLSPNDFDSHFYLGYLLKERGAYDDARSHLEKALLISPEAHHVTYHLAQVWLRMGEPGKARELLLPVVKATPDFAEAHMVLATACYRLNLKEEGDFHRDRVIELTASEKP